jgi:hypothetical protein
MAGLTITGYEYALATSADSYATYGAYQTSSWTSGTSFIITGLTNGTLYKIKLRAVNPLGKGAESVETNAFKPNTVPSTPSAATLTAGDATDTFTWTAPSSNGSTITKYAYQISADNGSNWYNSIGGTLNAETETANLSVILATQYSLSSYKLRVRAFNNGTNGGWSSYSTISSSGTAVWTSNTGTDTDTDTDTVCGPAGCTTTDTLTESHPTCPDCATGQYCCCGAQYAFRTRSKSRSGTRTSSRTRTRTRSTQYYSRSGSTSSGVTYGTYSEYSAYTDYTYSEWSYGAFPDNWTYTAYGSYGACDSSGSTAEAPVTDGNGYIIQYWSVNRAYPFYYQFLAGTWQWGWASDAAGAIGCANGYGVVGPGVATICTAGGGQPCGTTNSGGRIGINVTTSGEDTCGVIYCC